MMIFWLCVLFKCVLKDSLLLKKLKEHPHLGFLSNAPAQPWTLPWTQVELFNWRIGPVTSILQCFHMPWAYDHITTQIYLNLNIFCFYWISLIYINLNCKIFCLKYFICFSFFKKTFRFLKNIYLVYDLIIILYFFHCFSRYINSSGAANDLCRVGDRN